MAYLTTVEYVARFGERETGLFTNDATAQADPNAPAYDSAKVGTELANASDVIDGYVSTRYTTPLSSSPTLCKSWCGALAREALAQGTGRVSQAITDAANIARSQLAQLSAGKINLPVAEGETPPVAASVGAPLTSGDRAPPIFSGNPQLDAYTAPFTGGCQTAQWRQFNT